MHLNLISNSRPDQIKLVGRVPVDLAEAANCEKYAQPSTHKLLYCSVQADITFSIVLSRKTRSHKLIADLDRSALKYSQPYPVTFTLRSNPSRHEPISLSLPRTMRLPQRSVPHRQLPHLPRCKHRKRAWRYGRGSYRRKRV